MLAALHLNESVPDQVVWSTAADGLYTVSDAIRILMQSNNTVSPTWPKVIWGNNVPSKIMIFHWLAILNSIPVREILINRHILPSTHSRLCVWCLNEPETVNHLLLHYKWSSNIWNDLFRWWNIRWVIPGSLEAFSFDWFFGMGINASKFWKLIGPATIWAIWMARNDYIFNGKFICRSVLVQNIRLKVFLWATNLKFCHGLHSYVWEQNPFLLCY
ncbi:uncharacterized protein [Rutidosis leptorrhynchoides]|uniref:uncharacterized protein n=1 Tax=Rutidosis leptorrhynchoides TaxID=125765 RepID=UPI003A9913DA